MHLNICPKIQVLISHFSKFDDLLAEHWEKIVERGKIFNPLLRPSTSHPIDTPISVFIHTPMTLGIQSGHAMLSPQQ